MKYLFFDIECANRDEKGRNMIYSFGYLLADENLNIIEEQDIIINPNVEKWDWYVLNNMLAYSKQYVETQKNFSQYYTKIKKLIEDPSITLCGFSTKDDIGYLLDECNRYNLIPFKIKFFDIQRLEAKIDKSNKKSLSEAYIRWYKRLPNNMHRSDIDAKYTLEIAKAICKNENKKLKQLIDENSEISGITEGFKYGFNGEILESREERRERKKQGKQSFFNKRGAETKFRILKEECQDFLLKGSKNSVLFLRLLDNVSPKTKREKIFEGKKISLSLNYEFYNFKNMMKLVQLICDCGGEYVKKASLSNIFVKYHLIDQGEERKCSKYEYVKEEIKRGTNIKVIEFDDFLSILNLTEEELNALPNDDYEYLMDEKYKR